MGKAATATRSGRRRSPMRDAPGTPGHALLGERFALLLHPMDELHQFGRAAEVADAGIGVGTVGRIAAQCEEARDARVEELAHEAIRLGVRRAHAREVRHRLDVGVLEDVAQHRQRAVSRGTARAERDRDERGIGLGEPVDRATEGERRGIGARREELERDRRARPTVGVRPV